MLISIGKGDSMAAFFGSIPLTLIGMTLALVLGTRTWFILGVRTKPELSNQIEYLKVSSAEKQGPAISVFVILIAVCGTFFETSDTVASATWTLILLCFVSWTTCFYLARKMPLEIAHGRLNYKYQCERDMSKSAMAFSTLGLGATFLPSAFWHGKTSWRELDEAEVLKNFNKTLKACKRVKSLDIRTSMQLDYSPIERFKHLTSLRIKGSLESELNLSGLKNLEMLYGDSPSFQKISGTKDLTRLKFVSVNELKPSWFRQLPPSVERLFIRGRLQSSIDLATLPKLAQLGISNARLIDFGEYGWVADSVKVLDLTFIKEIQNASLIIQRFPSLSTCNVAGDEEIYKELRQSLEANIEVNFLVDA